jgi:mitogen-activated protein kinase 1/3
VSIQTRLHHRNIVQIENLLLPQGSSMETFDSVFIVMEICDTDLKHLCKKDIVLDSLCINAMMYSLLVGLRYLHSAGVWHRDLKPANCLVNQDCTVKICDFGLSRAIDNEEPQIGELPNTPREAGNATGSNAEATSGIVLTSQKAKKALTNHVVTRFYRAPELILLQPTYTEKIDTWSVGCIFAELLQLLPDGEPFEDRRPLFPGQTAYPWSPAPGHKDDCLYHTRGSREMMNIIFDCIGTPTPEEIDKLQREDSKQYINLFRKRAGSGLRSKFANVDPSSIDLLEKMLRFDASSRISDDDAIEHPLFAE